MGSFRQIVTSIAQPVCKKSRRQACHYFRFQGKTLRKELGKFVFKGTKKDRNLLIAVF